MTNTSAVGTNLTKKRIKNRKYDKQTVFWAYVMLSPLILGFLVFTLYPLCWAIRLAWFSYNGTVTGIRFVGFENFINVFTKDTNYWRAMLTTLQFGLMKIPIEIPFALFLAILLTRKLKGTGFFRTMFYMPNVVSVAIIGLIFSNMFSYFGVINNFLGKLGIANIDWFSTKMTSLWTLVIADTWHSFGINVLYFMAAINNVSEDLYEAAEVEGANKWQSFIHVTLPGIAPVLQVILMLSIVGTLGTNDLVLVLTNGAPGGETFTVMSYIVKAFVPGFADAAANIGYGCALSVVTAVIMAGITVIYNLLSKKMNDLY